MIASADQKSFSIVDVHVDARSEVISDVTCQMRALIQTLRDKHRLSTTELFLNSSTDWMAVDRRFDNVPLRPGANRMITEGPATLDEDSMT